jgi:hypothetical protein
MMATKTNETCKNCGHDIKDVRWNPEHNKTPDYRHVAGIRNYVFKCRKCECVVPEK